MMLYLVGCILFLSFLLFIMMRYNVKHACSRASMFAIIMGLLANISLAENVASNLMPEKNDGFSISTGVATWILGDDGGTLQKFKDAFDVSMYFTFLLIGLYVIVTIAENRYVSAENE
ncbi:hypothetical protein ACFQPF_02735 [Fictibacillus iocasae]|uniref:Uncharacterized protein n=1 Tax=Fictibacillus iocasae TaxID=2715437 RepID=A0ABW2NMZ9_9BACL